MIIKKKKGHEFERESGAWEDVKQEKDGWEWQKNSSDVCNSPNTF